METIDIILLTIYAAIIVAGSFADGRYSNYVWFKVIQPVLNKAEDASKQ